MDASIIAQFALATVLPAAATCCLAWLRKGAAKDLGYWKWQIACGLVFGAIAILGTEFGISTEDATMNVRDAAPITAGLLFGGPAGIIAGVMGGAERWFAALWGKGMFTRVSCSIATCAAGIYAALLRRYVFEGHRPGWQLAGVTGIVVEVLHLMLVLVTRPDDPARAFTVVQACTPPMVTCNAVAVALSVVAFAWVWGDLRRDHSDVPHITQVVQKRLLAAIVVGFGISAAFTLALQGGMARAQTTSLLTLALDDVRSDIGKASDNNLIIIARRVAFDLPNTSVVTQEKIDGLIREYDITEINVIDRDGIIVASSDEELVGYDMASGTQSAEFLDILPGTRRTQLVQAYQPMSYDANVWRKYAGVRIEDGFVQVAYDSTHFMDDLYERIGESVGNRHVGQNGALVVLTPGGNVVGTRSDLHPTDEDVASLSVTSTTVPEGSVFICDFMDERYYAVCGFVEGYQLFALQPVSEAELGRDVSFLVMAFMEVIVFALIFIAVYLFIRGEVVENVLKVNETLGQITQGDLQAEVDVRDNAEFISLSDDINTMVGSLRGAIEAEASRIDQELDYARTIQESALPRTFPPFPDVGAFDIYASMNAAREVGGDFYDFFLIDDHTLGFLIADVSGKGIPASLFMMAAKAELASYMSSGMTLAAAVETANWHLCQGNDASMFVTVWAASLDWDTGVLTYVNGGHNAPLLRHDGTWQWLKTRGGMFLGTFDTARYRSSTITLCPGDELILYTDGVNEAFSADGEQYGDKRLEGFLAKHASLHPRPLIDALRSEIARWSSGTEQSDDITMLALEYGVAPQATGSLTVPATTDQLEVILDFVHEALRGRSCPLPTQNQLDIVLEELFVNICNYAYRGQEGPGTATIEYIYNANPSSLTVSLSDYGAPFDLLDHIDPPTPASVEEAKIGGLGILMVKRMTDDLSYVRDDDQNVVAFVKGW